MLIIFAKLGTINIGVSCNPRILLLSLAKQGTWENRCVLPQADMELLHVELYEILTSTIFLDSSIIVI